MKKAVEDRHTLSQSLYWGKMFKVLHTQVSHYKNNTEAANWIDVTLANKSLFGLFIYFQI